MGARQLNLHQLRFTAKIDYITVSNSRGRMLPLPALDGSLKWSRKNHYRQLTIHDPSPSDLAKLLSVLGPDTPILELEIATDLAPAESPNLPLLREVMVEVFGRRLCPSAPSLSAFSRRAWRPHLDRLVPLGESPFMPEDQFLLGGRKDPVQVKCYLKRRDQEQDLGDRDATARVEVRLGVEELRRIGLYSLVCLDGFRFRKKLLPYFRHCTPVAKGRRGEAPARRRNETLINDRIGQALLRLERQHSGKLWEGATSLSEDFIASFGHMHHLDLVEPYRRS